ncbi:heterogeneous nuclear ribonucleoprotein 27C-like isoform X3 [Cloeon dipterum]
MRMKVEQDGEEKGPIGSLGGDNSRRNNPALSLPHEKLFVGGLSWETTQESLHRYFSRFGEVVDCVVMKNSESGRSRGFGFVTFSDPNNVGLVLDNGPHMLDGRTIDPKPCNPRSMQKPKRNVNWPKVFLGGLPSNVTETDLRNHFTSFGKVMEVVIMYDQEKKKSRGFGFLSFETDDAVERCVAEHFVNLNGKQVEIKKAEPRDMKMGDGPQGQWGPPQGGPPMSMGGGMGHMGAHNGQMTGPMGGHMGHMGPHGSMMQSYQGWGTPPQQQSYPGYGNPAQPGSYQGWGAPAAHQGQQLPPQWSANFGGPPAQQGYGGYGEMYQRQSGPGNPNAQHGQASGGSTSGQKGSNDYNSYASTYNMGNYAQVSQEASNYGPARSYSQDAASQGGGGYGHPPPPGGNSFEFSDWSS